MEYHPIANMFPMLSRVELEELADDIAANGLINPIMTFEGKILDGRNRFEACKLAGAEILVQEFLGTQEQAVAWVWSLNFTRRHLNSGQAAIAIEKRDRLFDVFSEAREKAEKRIKAGVKANNPPELIPEGSEPEPKEARETRTIKAKAAGTNAKYIDLAGKLLDQRPDLAEKVEAGEMKITEAQREMKKDAIISENIKASAEISEQSKIDINLVCNIRHCGCSELFARDIKPDAVITDPPYPYEFIDLFNLLAECCSHAKVPVVAVMSGQSYLPEVMEKMCRHLKYRWTMAYLTPGGQSAQLWDRKINTFWKPVLLFGESSEWCGDVVKSNTNDNEKTFHEWGQSISGMVDLIERITKPGQLICDPFVGGGTTAIASMITNRKFIGCDIDQKAFETSIERRNQYAASQAGKN